MKRISPIDTRLLRERLGDVLFRSVDSTTERRALILKLIDDWVEEGHLGVLCNIKHGPVLSRDKDIAHLIKTKRLFRIRIQASAFSNVSHTYITTKDPHAQK